MARFYVFLYKNELKVHFRTQKRMFVLIDIFVRTNFEIRKWKSAVSKTFRLMVRHK